jgi:hypothetical protein
MKEMEEEMQENREAFSVPDSGMTDSIRNYTQRIIKDWNGPRSPHFRQSMRPHAFDYNFNFDMPEVPEPPMPPLNGDRDEDTPRQFNFRDLRPSQEGSTLNDVIGNIPMDQVESYSIRETKHGKRITIELKNDPIIRQQENVIILREPKHPDRRGTAPRPEIRKRIIIKSAPDDKDNPGKL